MKLITLPARRSALRLLVVCLASAVGMAGCGVGGDMTAGVGTGGTGTFKASLTGSVADGYLINAVVFLDKNGNYQLDSDEPYAVTGADGTATLEASPADMAAYPVVAVAFKGITIDSASMLPIVTNYVLSFPKAGFKTTGSNNISPISTSLRELLDTGQYTTVQQAMAALSSHMALPADIDLLAENIAADNPALNAAARSIAALMWMQSSQILAPGGATPAVDVERYRAMMRLIENNMNIVSRFNTPENLINLNNNINAVLGTMPPKAAPP